MNGKRILNELIIIFIFLNITLLTFNIIKITASYRLNESRIQNVVYALEQKGIYLETQLPKEFKPKMQGNLSNLIGSNTTVERYELVSSFFGSQTSKAIVTKDSTNPNIITYKLGGESLIFDKYKVTYLNNAVASAKETRTISMQEAKKLCKAFINRLNYSKVFANAHIQYSEVENSLEMTFFEKYKGLPVFDAYITFQIVDGQIAAATLRVGSVAQLEGNMSKQSIYPIDLVLFGIDDELELEKPMYISNITLGYKAIDEKNIALLGAQLIPVYKIEIRGLNKPIYVNAYTNKRIE